VPVRGVLTSERLILQCSVPVMRDRWGWPLMSCWLGIRRQELHTVCPAVWVPTHMMPSCPAPLVQLAMQPQEQCLSSHRMRNQGRGTRCKAP
jgi:hypothetical protein